jgi:EAL domain-containing protein (putative c-di-GMP-specific phosphodiesterase class I)
MQPDKSNKCEGCRVPLDFELSMAFQPIVDMRDLNIFGYEALVRGPNGESAASMLEHVNESNRYAFDQRCRVRAVEMAAGLGVKTKLCVNFMPNAVYEPSRCLRTTLEVAKRTGFPIEQIIFEATEDERVANPERFRAIMVEYKKQGFCTAIDDFGAGYAGLHFLAEFQPDYLKVDIELVRNVDANRARQAIVKGIVSLCQMLGITVIAEGIETAAEMRALRDLGVSIMQGYLFSKPAFETLPSAELCRTRGVSRTAPPRRSA